MSKFDEIDLWYTAEGDLKVDSSGDLKDTSSRYGRAVVQEIGDYLKGTPGDWSLTRFIGAGLQRFRGRIATEQLKAEIEEAIIYALLENRLLRPSEINLVTLMIPDGILIGRLIVSTPRGELSIDLTYDSDKTILAGY
jgi:hypothetical protein